MKDKLKPSKEELLAAEGKGVPDIIAPNLRVLFCGINPGLYTAAIGHHFGRPGNRFWPALFAAGFTDRLLSPYEERELLQRGYGITNVVNRATASADQLSKDDFLRGAKKLEQKIQRYSPKILAILGVGAYRSAFNKPKATMGIQPEKMGDTIVWVLPNPSGLNANHQAADFARLFQEVRLAADPL